MLVLRVLKSLLFIIFILSYFLIAPCIVMTLACIQGSFIKAHKMWADLGCRILNVKFERLPESQEINQRSKTMLLLNHRSWSDFFIHDVVTDYTANYVSRLAVGIVFPSILILSYLSRSIWFFQRGKKGQLNDLFNWFSMKWAKAYRPNCVIYPEGHRRYNAENPGYLKKGMIGYAYRNKIDCQIVITFGNNLVCDEKRLQLSSGQTVYSYVGEVISPNNFQSEEAFYNHILAKFTEGFDITKNYLKENNINLNNNNIEQQQEMNKVK